MLQSIIRLTVPLVLVAFCTYGYADEALIRVLATDDSPRVRAQAALGLATKGAAPGVIKALIKALEDENRIVRGSAAKSLGALRSTRAFPALCRAAFDNQAFVSKWAKKSAKLVLSSASLIEFNVRGLVSRKGSQRDQLTKAYQEGVLEELLGREGFDVASYMDFREDADEEQSKRKVTLVFEGRVTKVSGDRRKATAEVDLKAVAVPGLVLWKGRGSGKGEGGEPPPPDPYDDVYSTVEGPEDAKAMAVNAAGRSAAAAFASQFDASEQGHWPGR